MEEDRLAAAILIHFPAAFTLLNLVDAVYFNVGCGESSVMHRCDWHMAKKLGNPSLWVILNMLRENTEHDKLGNQSNSQPDLHEVGTRKMDATLIPRICYSWLPASCVFCPYLHFGETVPTFCLFLVLVFCLREPMLEYLSCDASDFSRLLVVTWSSLYSSLVAKPLVSTQNSLLHLCYLHWWETITSAKYMSQTVLYCYQRVNCFPVYILGHFRPYVTHQSCVLSCTIILSQQV